MTQPIQIAIDGYSSTGKSTIAKQIAKQLNILYIDSGAMYRAVALYAIQNNCIQNNQLNTKQLIDSLDKITIIFNKDNSEFPLIQLNGKTVEQDIRTMHVAQWVSQVAEISEVRAKLVDLQRQISKDQSVIMDGRDIGTVVFPDAMVKIFITSSADIRAQRRFDELVQKGHQITYEEVYQNVTKRDDIDVNRKDSPLKQADDAILIDNSHLDKTTQVEMVLKIINYKISSL